MTSAAAQDVSPIETSADYPGCEFDFAAEQVASCVAIFADPEHVVELRALRCNGKKNCTRAGYYDRDHYETLGRNAIAINRYSPALYFTLNPVRRGRLAPDAGQQNKHKIVRASQATSDSDIVCRRWILIDIDGFRRDENGQRLKGEHSATDSEKTQCLELIGKVRDYLHAAGWPEPVFADSGNGYHLLYRIDEPAEDERLVERCLKALAAKFNTESVKVDTTVFNPSRICALYGTWKRKGENTPERPHRMTAVLEVPERCEIVPTDKLRELAAQAPADKAPESRSTSSASEDSEFGLASSAFLKRCRGYALKHPPAISGQNGHDVTFNMACNLVQRLGLSKDEALPILQDWNATCQPPWTTDELEHKLDGALKKSPRGELRAKWLEEDRQEREARKARKSMQTTPATSDPPHGPSLPAVMDPFPDDEEQLEYVLGEVDPETGKLVLSTSRTLPTAQAVVRDKYTHAAGQTLRSYANELYEWKQNRWAVIEPDEFRGRLQPLLHDAVKVQPGEDGEEKLVPFPANPTTVEAAVKTIQAHVHLPVSYVPPVWLNSGDHLPAREILASPNHLLHIPTKTLIKPTPMFFNTNAIEFDPDFSAELPHKWFAFLHQLFDGDVEALNLLQEWFGYCLSGDTSLQKMLLIVGPKRSGKGTIGRVLRRLLGILNVAGPTVGSLTGQFGLQPLIGKTLAIVSDARFSGKDIIIVVERLLCISGEDAVTIDRKHIGSITMKLPTRFMFFSNEVPRLSEASGALAGRFMILRLTESFFGRENPTLDQELYEELPGILNWALEGWQRLNQRGRFMQPQSVSDVVQDLEDLSSPVGSFVRDLCDVGSGNRIYVEDLYQAYRSWCQKEGIDHVLTVQSFGKDLCAAASGIRRRGNSTTGRFYDGIKLKGQA